MRAATHALSLDVEDIARLFAQRGWIAYAGEAVSQTEHALQTAWLAELDGAGDALIAAALLHDLGHLLPARESANDSPTLRGEDDQHQYTALPLLRPHFGPEVLEPIRLHVDAKRYLCATRPRYQALLSADSVRSLALQGGPFSPEQAVAFIARPWAADAVALRQWDDAAKLPALATPPLEEYLEVVARVRLR